MSTVYQILALVSAGLIVWFTYRTIKGQPQQFSPEKISKSLYTMGIIAVLLIAFIALLVAFVRA